MSSANWKNVNNWHWIEKDCTKWAHDWLKANLVNLTVSPTDPTLTISQVTKVDGDVSVNQRKGKVKQLMDLEIILEVKSAEGTTGTVKIVDFTADSTFEDFEFRFTGFNGGSGQVSVVAAVVKREVWLALDRFRQELHEIHGKPLLVAVNNANNAGDHASPPKKENITAELTKPVIIESIKSPQSQEKTTTLEETVEFTCQPEDLYSVLTETPRILAWSRSPASSLPQLLLPGAPFSLFDGSITGTFRTLTKPTTIEMDWKCRVWGSDFPASNVKLDLSADGNGKTLLKIKQVGIPAGQLDLTRANWHKYYWTPIKMTFGFGSFL